MATALVRILADDLDIDYLKIRVRTLLARIAKKPTKDSPL